MSSKFATTKYASILVGAALNSMLEAKATTTIAFDAALSQEPAPQ